MGYYNDVKRELEDLISSFDAAADTFDKRYEEHSKQNELDQKNEKVLKQIAKERQTGFPILAKAYEDFWKLQDKEVVSFLRFKDKPAIQASKLVAEYARMRRKAEKENKILKYIIDFYEDLAPFLLEYKEEVPDITDEDRVNMAEFTEEELEDRVTTYLTKSEYRKLSTVEKNQIALDRYWKRPKSNWQIGKMYERYVGYLYEMQGYNVDYQGIFKGFEDLGRDLVCSRGKDIVVIQCKYWSHFKTLYEKHIFQFFGTVFQYRDENKGRNVRAFFYCTTKLSDLARRFAQELKIELEENHKFDKNYPCIKCNISRVDGTKIYHLPFDQQYDTTRIETNRGEFYASTVTEAEEKGFRRAWKWKGTGAD